VDVHANVWLRPWTVMAPNKLLQIFWLNSSRQSRRQHPKPAFGMATTANSLRLCVRARSQISTLAIYPRRASLLRRALSTTTARCSDEGAFGDDDEAGTSKFYDTAGDVLKDIAKTSENNARLAQPMLDRWEQLSQDEVASLDKLTKEVIQETAEIRRPVRITKTMFWNTNEPESDMVTDEIGEDEFEEDDMTSMAHGKLEEHREYREYARIAIWEMPLLASKLIESQDACLMRTDPK
jgi:small subunit ribosomal protein S35